jgi:uncharacterized protein YxeA
MNKTVVNILYILFILVCVLFFLVFVSGCQQENYYTSVGTDVRNQPVDPLDCNTWMCS